MKNEVKEYLEAVRQKVSEKGVTEEFSAELLTRISFYQHERLIHLIVTMTFAVMTVISFFMLVQSGSLPALLLSLLFLALVIPYIYHYYFLENSVQELYRLYYKTQEILKGDKK
ncbi:MAG: hypothetical protein ACI4J4_00290 [Ruminiclostridium sp.]